MGSRLFASCTTVLVLGVAPSTWLCSADARGEIITFRFEGTLQDVRSRGLPPFELGEWPAVGSRIAGTYRFDSNAEDLSADPTRGLFRTPGPSGGIDVAIGLFLWKAEGTSIGTLDNMVPMVDIYEVGDAMGMSLTSHPPVSMDIGLSFFSLLIEGDGNLLQQPLPAFPPPLDGAFKRSISILIDSLPGQGTNDRRLQLVGSLDALLRVPEPHSLLLLAVGGAVFIWR